VAALTAIHNYLNESLKYLEKAMPPTVISNSHMNGLHMQHHLAAAGLLDTKPIHLDTKIDILHHQMNSIDDKK
jgi:hypothetical protein